MFGSSYFGQTFFGSAYWGPEAVSDLLGGGKVTKAKRKLTKAELDGLRNIYDTEEILPEVEYEVIEQAIETVDKVETVIDVSSLEAAEIQFGRVLTLTTEQKRDALQETEDIGLILAIIESLED